MYNDLETPGNGSSFFSALTGWNHTEDLFREHFGEDSLLDREFLKLKLREYDRMWYRFSRNALTRDERALLSMLRIQRRWLRKTLYHGSMRRLWNRLFRFAAFQIGGRQRAIGVRDDSYRYADPAKLLQDHGGNGRTAQDPARGERREHGQRYGHDLGKRETLPERKNRGIKL